MALPQPQTASPRSRHCNPLDRTFVISISSPLEAYRRLSNLVTHDPPMTNLSLSRSTSLFPSIFDHSLFLSLSVWPNFFSLMNGFVLIFVSLSIYIEIFYYKICLEAEKMWETSRKIAFSECNQTPENIFQNNFHNVAKHLKIFSFPKNIFTWKYFTCYQTQPKMKILMIWHESFDIYIYIYIYIKLFKVLLAITIIF